MARADTSRMHSIKLIHPNHLDYPILTGDFEPGEGRLPLMNFSGEGNGPSIAANLPVGHRSLVYVIHHQKFIWAIEYVGTLNDGERVAAAHRIPSNDFTSKWRLYRPIRFLARVDLANAPTAEDIYRKTGIAFKANSFTLKYISTGEYQAIYDAIEWQTRDGVTVTRSAPAELAGPLPVPLSLQLPPITHAATLLQRIEQVRGLPERNMEDLVKGFLILLGHPEEAVRFQVGHVDVRVEDGNGRPLMVVEVKRSLLIEKALRDARRQGFDYAAKVGSPMVVITDADIYEVYDRRRGADYDSMLCGRFQLTKFRAEDARVLDVLRRPAAADTGESAEPGKSR